MSEIVRWEQMLYGVGMQYLVTEHAAFKPQVGKFGELVSIDFSSGEHVLRFADGTRVAYAPAAVKFVACRICGEADPLSNAQHSAKCGTR